MNDKEYEERKKKEKEEEKKKQEKNTGVNKNKEFADQIHMEIHAVRRIKNYKASQMEINVSKFVIERFKDECKECKEVSEKKKQQPTKKKGFLDKLGNLADKY